MTLKLWMHGETDMVEVLVEKREVLVLVRAQSLMTIMCHLAQLTQRRLACSMYTCRQRGHHPSYRWNNLLPPEPKQSSKLTVCWRVMT